MKPITKLALTVWLVVSSAIMVVEWFTLTREREENRVLVARMLSLGQQGKGELASSQAEGEELSKLRGENQEVHRLRNEVSQLRAQKRDLERLRAENQQ